jgi:hypothetical protein
MKYFWFQDFTYEQKLHLQIMNKLVFETYTIGPFKNPIIKENTS